MPKYDKVRRLFLAAVSAAALPSVLSGRVTFGILAPYAYWFDESVPSGAPEKRSKAARR